MRETGGDECLVEIHDHGGDVPYGSTLCQVASGNICTFNLRLCRNQLGCERATFKKTIGTTGPCNPGKLRLTKAQSSCASSFVGIKVRTQKHGKKMGACTIRVSAKSSGKPVREDVDKVTLECMPAGSNCPGATTTTVSTSTTTTTTQPGTCTGACPIHTVFLIPMENHDWCALHPLGRGRERRWPDRHDRALPQGQGRGLPEHHPLYPQLDAAHDRGDLRRDGAAGRRGERHRLERLFVSFP